MYRLAWLILGSKEMGVSLMLSPGLAVDGNVRISVVKKVSKVSPATYCFLWKRSERTPSSS